VNAVMLIPALLAVILLITSQVEFVLLHAQLAIMVMLILINVNHVVMVVVNAVMLIPALLAVILLIISQVEFVLLHAQLVIMVMLILINANLVLVLVNLYVDKIPAQRMNGIQLAFLLVVLNIVLLAIKPIQLITSALFVLMVISLRVTLCVLNVTILIAKPVAKLVLANAVNAVLGICPHPELV